METRRLRAVPYFTKGSSERYVAKRLGVSQPTVHQWKVNWIAKGESGLRAGKYGPLSKLSPQEERKIKKNILKGAEASGFSGDFWTISRITSAIRSWSGVAYRERSVWHVLHRLGFSCQKPVKRAVERDEEAIKTWLSRDWPGVKRGALKTA
jgi:transposase